MGTYLYYAETVMGDEGIAAVDSALATYLAQSAAVEKAAAVASGGTAAYLDSMRASSKAAMIVKEIWSAGEWPEPLERWAVAGPPRELDAMDRSAYRRSGGLGAPAKKVVLGRLDTVLQAPSYALLGHLLHITPAASADAQVQALRRAQQVFRIENADVVTLGSLARLVANLAQRRNLLQSEEVQGLPLDERVEYFVGLGEAPDTVASSGLGLGGPSSGAAPSGAKGSGLRSARFDEGKLLMIKASAAYIDQKRAGLAAIAAGHPHRALRIFLSGKLPPAPVSAVVPGAPAPPPPEPLLVFHIILFDEKLEAYTVDKDLHPLQELRAHIPAYLREAATGAMRGGPWRCRLVDFAKTLGSPSDWKS